MDVKGAYQAQLYFIVRSFTEVAEYPCLRTLYHLNGLLVNGVQIAPSFSLAYEAILGQNVNGTSDLVENIDKVIE